MDVFVQDALTLSFIYEMYGLPLCPYLLEQTALNLKLTPVGCAGTARPKVGNFSIPGHEALRSRDKPNPRRQASAGSRYLISLPISAMLKKLS